MTTDAAAANRLGQDTSYTFMLLVSTEKEVRVDVANDGRRDCEGDVSGGILWITHLDGEMCVTGNGVRLIVVPQH